MRRKTTREAADKPVIAGFVEDDRKGGASGSHFFKKVRIEVRNGGARAVSAAALEQGEFTAAEPVQDEFIEDVLKRKVPFPPPKNPKFTFIDRIYEQTQGDKSRLEELPDAGV